MATGRETSAAYGIAFHVILGDRDARTRIQRAPNNSPTSSEIEAVTVLAPGESLVVDTTPAKNEDWFYRSRHEKDGYDDSDWTPWVGRQVVKLPSEFPPAPSGLEVPAVDEDPEESDQTGTLNLTVFDPHEGNLTVRFWTRSGKKSSWSAVDERTGVADGSTVTKTVSLVEDHHSYIRYEVVSSAGESLGQRIVEFDPDNTPKIQVSSQTAEDGTVIVELRGDSDTTSIHRKPQGDPDTSYTQVIGSRQGSDSLSLDGTVQNFEYAGQNSSGRFGPSIVVTIGKSDPSGTPPRVDAEPTTQTGGLFYDIFPVPTENSIGPFEVRYRVKLDYEGETFGAWSAWQTASQANPLTVTVQPHPTRTKTIQMEARDTALNDLVGPRATHDVSPILDGLDSNDDGKVDPDTPLAGTGGGIFEKSAPADPDDARSIPYQDGTPVDDLEPSEVGAEQTAGKNISILNGDHLPTGTFGPENTDLARDVVFQTTEPNDGDYPDGVIVVVHN